MSVRREIALWAALIAAVVVAGWVAGQLGLPASYMFGGLMVAIAFALYRPGQFKLSNRVDLAAQAVAGVALGSLLDTKALSVIGVDWPIITLVATATLAGSLLIAVGLARMTSLDLPTAGLGMIPGGATGIIAMARELGADDRLVAYMQYLRVLVVVAGTPLVAALAFPAGDGNNLAIPSLSEPALGTLGSWMGTLIVAVVGLTLARLTKLPGGPLLGPLLLACAVVLWIPSADFVAPPIVRESAFALIGIGVGLGFTIGTVRQAGRLLLPVVTSLAAVLVLCFGLAVLLAAATPFTLLDAYLATTPGGLLAVVATGFGTGANTTFVVAIQGIRLLVMVILAPLAVRLLLHFGGRPVRHAGGEAPSAGD